MLKNKIIYRSQYRGSKELDLLMSSFVKSIINDIGIDELLELNELVNLDDENLMDLRNSPVDQRNRTSNNIINAAKYCNENNIRLITLSGFDKSNPLAKLGDVNIHINSNNYNYIEMSHHIILVSIVDIFAENLV